MPDLGPGVVIGIVVFCLGMARILRGPVGEALGEPSSPWTAERDRCGAHDRTR